MRLLIRERFNVLSPGHELASEKDLGRRFSRDSNDGKIADYDEP
jgi:hypothetical protein